MPSIGLRLSSSAGAGMAAGLQRAREIGERKQQLQFDQDEHEYAQEQREKAASEERATHSWMDDQYASFADDESKIEAYRALPLEVKGAVLKQAQAERGIKTMMRRAGTDLQRLQANPRFAEKAQEIQQRLQGDPLSVDIQAVSKEIEQLSDEAAHLERLTFKGQRVMMEAQEWMSTIQRPDEYDMGKLFTTLSRLQSELESSQDPDMEPMTQEDLEDLEQAVGEAMIPVKVKTRMEADVEARLMAQIDSIFQESLGEDYDPKDAPPPQDPERARSMMEMRAGGGQEVGPGGDEFTRLAAQAQAGAQEQPEAAGASQPAAQSQAKADPRLPTPEMMAGQTTGAAPTKPDQAQGDRAQAGGSMPLKSAEGLQHLRPKSDDPLKSMAKLTGEAVASAHGSNSMFQPLVNEAAQMLMDAGFAQEPDGKKREAMVEAVAEALMRSGFDPTDDALERIGRIAESGKLTEPPPKPKPSGQRAPRPGGNNRARKARGG